jgi:hypothetical protein
VELGDLTGSLLLLVLEVIMSSRMLETVLATSPITSLKPGCSACEKRHLCHRLVGVMDDIARIQTNVWDLEYKLRFNSLKNELNKLGFEFPDSVRNCEITRMTHKEATNLLREAQELLIEMKSNNEIGTLLSHKSV